MLLENHNTPDNSLWMNFINGNDDCFEIIYRKYADVLFRYGIQFTPDGNLVQDAIHDIFVKLYNDRKKLKAEANIKFYLFACLKNRLYNLLKRELFFDKIDPEENEYLDQGAEEAVTNALNQSEIQRTVQTVLGVLTDRQREIIYYRYIEELSIEEIAALTEMNYQSVQNLIQRSLKKIRDSLPIIILFFIFCEKDCFC
ncbi:MAG: RNA polymerase sigma factor [Parabacteroides gordonii]